MHINLSLSDREIVVLHNALLVEKKGLEMELRPHGDTKTAEFLKKDIKEITKLIEKLEVFL